MLSLGEHIADVGVIGLGGGVPKDFTQQLTISQSPRKVLLRCHHRRALRQPGDQRKGLGASGASRSVVAVDTALKGRAP